MSEALTRHIVTFGRVLREAGLEVGPGRIADALRGLDRVDITRQDDVYWTLRTTLVARREDLEPFDRAFDAWFLRRGGARAARAARSTRARCTRAPARVRRDARPAARRRRPTASPTASATARTRSCARKDFAAMTPEELAAARALIAGAGRRAPAPALAPAAAAPARPRRSTCARWPATRSPPAATRSRRRFRRRTRDAAQARRAVRRVGLDGGLLARAAALPARDASRSGRGVEVFAFGTRLTRLTAELRTRDPEQALARAADARRRLGGRHAHRRVAEALQRRLGPARADPRRGRR